MIQFARLNRWLLPLTLLLIAVMLHLITRADASERREQRSASTHMGALEYEDAEDEMEGALEESGETQVTEPLTTRTRKRSWQYASRSNLAVVPLILAAIAATYVAAGYVMQRFVRRGPGVKAGAAEVELDTKAPGAAENAFAGMPSEPEAGETVPQLDTSESTISSLIKTGRRVLPPAAALALASGVVALVVKYGDVLGVTPTKPQ